MSPGVKSIRTFTTALAVVFLLIVSGFLPAWFGCPSELPGLLGQKLDRGSRVQKELRPAADRSASLIAGRFAMRSHRDDVSFCSIFFEKMTIDEREFANGRTMHRTQYIVLHTPDARIAGLVLLPAIPFAASSPKYVLHSALLV